MAEEIKSDPRIATLIFEIGDSVPAVRMKEKDAINYILASLRDGPGDTLRGAFDAMRSVNPDYS